MHRTQESSVSMLMRRRDARVDVTCDPEEPTRVRGGRAVGHLAAGVVLGLLGLGGVLPSVAVFVSVTVGALLPG
ncbi:hypothetical protein [Streptomyces sp. NPDC001985]|uniref:hypothetical protein n=1 Tax=Streptomyces sp. NPDC001985 TaxID=3154406 RepID=UPI00332B7302